MINLDITARLPRRVAQYQARLTAGFRGALHRHVGSVLRELTSEYIFNEAQQRHDTANRLGAEPSGHLEQAAEKVTVSVRGETLSLHFNHPGLSRAFHPVTITPHGDYPLTIPIHAIAYNRRAGQLRLEGYTLFRPLKKGAKAIGHKIGADRRTALFAPEDRMNILAARAGWGLLKLYALCRQVTQPQDRTLLPSDEEYRAAAAEAAKEYIRDRVIAERSGS